VLAVRHDASDAEVRAAWKAALSEAHPDRARARGLPSEFVEVAEAKAAAINAAFDAGDAAKDGRWRWRARHNRRSAGLQS